MFQRSYTIAFLWMAVVFVVDRATKIVASAAADPLPPGPFPSILTLVRHYNEGIIANIPIPIPVIILISLSALVYIGILLRQAIQAHDRWGVVAFGILIGGALGNLYDRLTHGYVIDWILLFGRSAVNLADVAILIGILFAIGRRRKPPST